MKGLLLLAKPKGDSPMGKGMGKPDDEAAEGESGGSEMKFARLASEAMAEGDHESAAKALVGMVKACMASSEAGEYEE
jgi:hypothetical protein